LLSPTTCSTWIGNGANDEERAVAGRVTERLKGSRNVEEFREGQESDEFWETLGGKTEYVTSKVMDEGAHDPRLFQGSNVTGSFVMEEIFNFSQEDLTNDDTFLLDTFNEVWVWVGSDSNKQEKKEAFQAALDFVQNAPDGRDPDTPILKVDAGVEPPLFTAHFLGWDDKKFSSGDPYLEKLKALKGSAAVERITNAMDALGYRPTTDKFSYEELKNKTADKIDPTKRHEYLEDSEFERLFGMNLEAFDNLAEWKRSNLKKKLQLF